MRFPSTLLDFQTQFPDDDHCWAYLRRARWPRGFLCPRCGGRGRHFLASRRLEQCRACRYQSSVTAGTVFHGTRVPLLVDFQRSLRADELISSFDHPITTSMFFSA